MGYREVFAGEKTANDPGMIFYTIRQEDMGKEVIRTPEIIIYLVNIMGYIQSIDVGKRLYRVPTYRDGQTVGYVWQVENNAQRDERLAAEK